MGVEFFSFFSFFLFFFFSFFLFSLASSHILALTTTNCRSFPPFFRRYGDSSKNENAVKGSCKEMLGISEPCGAVKQRQWMETVYDTRGGPSPELRKKILHHAHVRSCADAAAVKASIHGTPCPQSPDVGGGELGESQ